MQSLERTLILVQLAHFFMLSPHLHLLNALIDGDESSFNIELETFVKNIKKKVIVIIDYFLSFLIKYDERKTHNMLTLMWDLKFEILKLIYSLISHGHWVVIIKNIIKNPCFLCSWNLIIICMHCLRLKVPLFTKLMKMATWTFSK